MPDTRDYGTDMMTRDKLREPFDPKLISQLPRTNKRPALDYVGHAAVTDRLNSAAPGWTMGEPVFTTVMGTDGLPHVMAVICPMTIGDTTRWEVGAVDSPSSYGQEAKEAMSDWVRRAAMRFGVALDLWSKEDLSVGESTARGSAQAAQDAASPSSVGAGVTRK